MVRGIRPLAAAGAVLLLLTACASTATNISSGASCAAILHFRGQTYYGEAPKTRSPYTQTGRVQKAHMHVIGTGILPACRDTNHSANDHDLPVPVARIDDVDPGTAVAQYPWGLVFVNQLALTTTGTS